MSEQKKSVNKLWREMGKPMPFKEFVELYNIADLYNVDLRKEWHNASGDSNQQNTNPPLQNTADSTTQTQYIPSQEPKKEPCVTCIAMIAVGAVAVIIGGYLIAKTLTKKS